MSSAEEVLEVDEGRALRARFVALLTAHGPGLRRVARAYAARTDETEDLLQEIALALWRALPAFRGECSDRTFVFRVAHNRGITFVERGGRVARGREEVEIDAIAIAGAATAEEHLEVGTGSREGRVRCPARRRFPC